MEANELRIGNLIWQTKLNVSNGRQEKSVIPANYHILHDIINGKGNYAPIPLTEEWLMKFGFACNSGDECKKDRFTYRKQQKDLIVNGFEYDYNGIICYPEYVHQLQNLYFALTGSELSKSR